MVTMKKTAALTRLVLETFRLNGRLLVSGDALVGDIGLTSARWQVIGAIAESSIPLPVAHIARKMGLSRQTVQWLSNEMKRDGLVRFEANPAHRRAQLVVLTPRGKAAYRAAMKRQRTWIQRLAVGLSLEQIEAARSTLLSIRRHLEDQSVQDGEDD
jgi:DNA-binding MarR family transcriptional regulator